MAENEDELMTELVNQMEDMDEELIRQIRAGNFLYIILLSILKSAK